MYALEQWAQGSNIFFVRHSSLINITVIVIVIIAVIINFFKYSKLYDNYPKIALLILLFFFYSFISIYWSPRIDLSYAEWGKYWPYFVTFLLASPFLITKDDDLKTIFNVFSIVGGIVVYSLLFHVEWGVRRIVFIGGKFNNELLGNPLAVAQMAGYLFFVYMFTLRKKTPNKVGFFNNLLKCIMAACCLFLIVKSGSRGQLLGLVVTFIVLYPLVYKVTSIKGLFLIAIISFIIGEAILWSLEDFGGEGNRWNQEAMENSMGGRLDNAFLLLNYWYKDPFTLLFGLGNSASFDPRILGIYPHFLPLEVLGEEGLIGFCIYFLILFGVIRSGYKIIKITNLGTSNREYSVVFIAMVCYSFFLSLKQGSLLGNMEFFMAAIILGKYELMINNKQ
jgi:hypothetical protein